MRCLYASVFVTGAFIMDRSVARHDGGLTMARHRDMSKIVRQTLRAYTFRLRLSNCGRGGWCSGCTSAVRLCKAATRCPPPTLTRLCTALPSVCKE
jgi:hypothetical protein